MKRFVFLPIAVLAFLLGCQSTPEDADSMDEMDSKDSMAMEMSTERFTVKIEVLEGSLTPLAPVVWAVHKGANPFLSDGMDHRPKGLEALAEDGNPEGLATAVGMIADVSAHGVAAVPDMAMEAGPALPGHAYSFTFDAADGDKLSFATMFVQSNDLFYSTGTEGLSLYTDMKSISGDVTGQIILYDAGTEVNEEPGMGSNQPLRQSGPNVGMDEMGSVQPVSETNDGFMYPGTASVIKVSVHQAM